MSCKLKKKIDAFCKKNLMLFELTCCLECLFMIGGNNEIDVEQKPPKIMEIQPSRTLEVSTGGQIQLFCSVEVSGVPATVSWLRNGQPIGYGPTLYLGCFKSKFSNFYPTQLFTFLVLLAIFLDIFLCFFNFFCDLSQSPSINTLNILY